jgi:RHS repeat-associated protein
MPVYPNDGNGNKVYKKIADKETFYVRDGAGNTLALYEKGSFGDTLVQPFDTTAEQKKWLWELLKPRFLGDTIFECFNEENFGLFFREECLLPGKTIVGARSAICSGLAGLATGLVDSVAAHFDLACVGIAIYDSSFFDWDTGSFTCGIRYKRLVRSEAYLYGSARLGLDTEEQVIGDSLEKYKAVYNPLCHQWQYLHSLYTFDQIFASVDTSTIRYNEAGWKRYEFGNHLGNVLAVISDRKLLKDTLGGYFLADLYSMQDYDPFGMVQPGRSWKRKKYKYSFNGKEEEYGLWVDYGFRNYNSLIARFISVDPLKDSYASWTPFAYAMNRPVDGVDMDGLEWSDADKDYKINIYVRFNSLTYPTKAKDPKDIYEVREAEENHRKLIEHLESSRMYAEKIFANNNLDVKISHIYVEDFTAEHKFRMEIVDNDALQVSGEQCLNGSTAVRGNTKENLIRLGITNCDPTKNSRVASELGATEAHELGHTAGLPHPWEANSPRDVNQNILDLNQEENKNKILFNIMNSGENPDKSLKNTQGRDTFSPGQIEMIKQTVKDNNEKK